MNNECPLQAELGTHLVESWETSKVKGPKVHSVRPTAARYIKHAKQQHLAKRIFSMVTESPFSWYPHLDAVIYIEITVNIHENSIKWKEIFTRLLSIAFAPVCNEDASWRERFVKMTKLHHLTNWHHHTLVSSLCSWLTKTFFWSDCFVPRHPVLALSARQPHLTDFFGNMCCYALQWLHDECDSVSNHGCLDCFLNRLFVRLRLLCTVVSGSGADQGNIKSPRHWPFLWESTGDSWIPLTKGQ